MIPMEQYVKPITLFWVDVCVYIYLYICTENERERRNMGPLFLLASAKNKLHSKGKVKLL